MIKNPTVPEFLRGWDFSRRCQLLEGLIGVARDCPDINVQYLHVLQITIAPVNHTKNQYGLFISSIRRSRK